MLNFGGAVLKCHASLECFVLSYTDCAVSIMSDNFYPQNLLADRNLLRRVANYDSNLDCVICVSTRPISEVEGAEVYQSQFFCKFHAIESILKF